MELVELEMLWAEQLKSVSVIFQLEFDDADAQRALTKIGGFFENPKIDHPEKYIQQQWPASFLVGINKIASSDYRQGELWGQIFSALNLEPTQVLSKKLASTYQSSLDRFELERFEHPLPYIGEMLLHSGIPVVSLPAFFKKLLKEYQETDRLTGAEFNAVIREYVDSEVQGKGLDMPTFRFIKQSGFIADDFVDKCIDIIDDMQDGKYDEGGGSGLPHRVIAEAVRLIEEAQAQPSRSVSKQRRKGSEKPKIRWDDHFTDNEFQIELPRLSDLKVDTVVWRLEGMDAVKPLITHPALASTESNDHFVLSGETPAVALIAAYEEHGSISETTERWNISIYSDKDALLVFDSNGYLISGQSPLEPAHYTILFPASWKGQELDLISSASMASNVIDPPSGWAPSAEFAGWKAYRVDVNTTSSFKLTNGMSRVVSRLKRPKLNLSDALLSGVFSSAGQPILSKLPEIELPGIRDTDALWSVVLRDERRDKVWELNLDASDSARNVNLEEFCLLDLDGDFELSINSPVLGGSTRESISLVSGLSVELTPPVRRLKHDGSGLELAVAKLKRNSTIATIALGSNQFDVIVEDPKFALNPFVVRPGHESIELFNKNSGNRTKWLTPALSHIEDLANLELTFRNVDGSNGVLVAVWGPLENADIHPLRQFSEGSRSRYQLGELIDDAGIKGSFRLLFRRYDGTEVTVANCSNKKLWQSFVYDADTRAVSVVLNGSQIPEHLKAFVQPSFARWVPALEIGVSSHSIEIPADITRFGDFSVTLAVSPPWAPHDPSERGNHTFTVENRLNSPDDSAESQIAFWLSTGAEVENMGTVNYLICWHMIFDENICSRFVNRPQVKAFAEKHLRANPTQALDAYPISSARTENYLRDFFLAGLIDVAPIANQNKLAEASAKPFLSSLFLGDKADTESINHLAGVAERSWGLKFEVPDGQEMTTEEASRKALSRSSVFLSLCYFIGAKAYPTPHPCLGDDELFERFLLSHQLPKGQFYSDGTLVQLFKSLKESAATLVGALGPSKITQLAETLSLIEKQMPLGYQELAATRPFLTDDQYKPQDEPGVHVGEPLFYLSKVPAISLRLTAMARLAARGHAPARKLWLESQDFYKTLSIHTPELIEHDLVTSELYLSIGTN